MLRPYASTSPPTDVARSPAPYVTATTPPLRTTSSTCRTPRAVSMIGMSALPVALPSGDKSDSAFGTTSMETSGSAASAPRSRSPSGVPGALIRTPSSRCPQSAFRSSAPRDRRADSFSSGGTASSKSKRIESASMAAALAIIRGLFAGTYSWLRRRIVRPRCSVRPRQAEGVVRDVREDEIVRDRGDLVQPRLQHLPFDVHVPRHPIAAVDVHRHVGRAPRALRREVFRDVRVLADFLRIRIGLIQSGRMPSHEVRGDEARMRVREGKLNALVAPDRSAEHHPSLRVFHGPVDEPAGVPDALGGDQDPLRIEDVEEGLEPLALRADRVAGGDLDIVQEQLVRLAVEHRANPGALDPLRLPKVDEEEAQPLRPLRALPAGCRACDEHHEVALLDAGDEDLVAPNPIAVALSFRDGRNSREVGSRVRLREGEALHSQLAAGQVWKVLPPGRVGGESRHEKRKVELTVERLGVAAAGVDLLEEKGRIRENSARAAVLRRNQETSKALGLELRDERLRVRFGILEALPVIRRKAIHEARDGGQHDPLGLIRHERHATSPPSCGP